MATKKTKKTATTKTAKAEKKPKATKAAGSLEAIMVDTQGKSAGTLSLPESIFGLPWNADLVHQVVHSMRTAARTPVAHTKDRGEVRGGGKKPWKQKGTGRARHGSTRSPIWVGGGVAHGPRNEKNFDRKVNKKMKAKALFTLLSRKNRDGEVLFVKDLSLDAPKTVAAKAVLAKLGSVKGFEALATRRNNAALIAVSTLDTNVKRGFNNFGSLEVTEIRNINPLALLQYKYVVISNPEESFKSLAAKMETK